MTACTAAGRCPQGHHVYQISQVDFIPFFSKIEVDGKHNPPLNADAIKQLKGVQKLLEEQSFYFSYYTDLSSNQERQSIERASFQAKNKSNKDILWWRRPKKYNEAQLFEKELAKKEEAKESEQQQIEAVESAETLETDLNVKTIEGYERHIYHMDIRYIWNWGLLRDFQY